ncbi:MAG: adenylosuccinate synthase [SAR202 cluster bacterium]|nr:adenylosuccinate synthase [SAR202 cluster bacterium]
MPAYAVLGAQWGDEGKGKIIDFLSRDADIVARFAGGNNAGHTVFNDDGQFSLHLVPSGIFWPQALCVIGNGVVVDPDVLLGEIEGLLNRGIDISDRLVLSERTHLIMPYHVMLDGLAETARGGDALGTTRKGIGPTYSDKAARTGIRAADLLDLESLMPRLKSILDYNNALITKIYGAPPLAFDDVFEKCRGWAERLTPLIAPVEQIVHDALENGKSILLEGAQGALLDLDHGTYPFVTSSNSTIGGACIGLGIPPGHISGIIGVFKAYSTRVGAGPFPSELLDETGEKIRDLAQEFGTTTGRPRRVGWFDAVAARYSAQVNGYTSAVLTRLDVLDGFDSVKICTAYEHNGTVVERFPAGVAALERCRPVYEEHPGWDSPTASVTRLEELPREARSYVDRLQELINCSIDIISTGPHRHETVLVRPVLSTPSSV